ncbi:hypothetical protein WJX74_006750 [Apatococcus lobatus]|uniref:VPS9 domain-containing protein n=1 Tax=Apatococcus lobatus TaxID=904363 RepID=A0AAW1RIL2_9CHLO
MADETGLAEATQPFAFQDFLERMKDPAAADLVKSIKSFIQSLLERKPDPDTAGRDVQAFLEKSEASFHLHPVWANSPPEHQLQGLEGLEKYLMTKLHNWAFGQSAADRERDDILQQRMQALEFVRPVHLEIPDAYQDENSLDMAMAELKKIDHFKAPRDKLVCILNCCRVLNNVLQTSSVGAHEARGADDFLPLLIFTVIHANPPNLASNLEYIQRFRFQSRMISESAYFYTQLYSAASFIETINASSLSMDPDEFVARMVAAGVPDMELSAPPGAQSDAALAASLLDDDQGTADHSKPVVASSPKSSMAQAQPLIDPSTGHLVAPHAAPPGAAPGTPGKVWGRPDKTGSGMLHLDPPPDPSRMSFTSLHPHSSPAAQQQQQHRDLLSPVPASPNLMDSSTDLFGPAAETTIGASWPSVAELAVEGVSLLVQQENAVASMQQQHAFLLASAPSLRVQDVPELLRLYKELVLQYTALSMAVTHRHASQQLGSAPTADAAMDSHAAQNSAAAFQSKPIADTAQQHQHKIPQHKQSPLSKGCFGV